MLQKNPLFLFPLSYFGSAEEQSDMEFSEETLDGFLSEFVLEHEKPDPYPEKIGSFLLWTEVSTIANASELLIEDSLEFF
jgi:hypothetical protein